MPLLIFFSAPSYAGNFISLPRVRMYSTIINGIYITPSVLPRYHPVSIIEVAKSPVLLIHALNPCYLISSFLENFFENYSHAFLIYVLLFRQSFRSPFLLSIRKVSHHSRLNVLRFIYRNKLTTACLITNINLLSRIRDFLSLSNPLLFIPLSVFKDFLPRYNKAFIFTFFCKKSNPIPS